MDDEALLAVVYRGRPTTIGEVSTLSHLGHDEAVTAVDRLRARGLLSGNGDEVEYPNPATWVAETLSATQVAELRLNAQTVLADMERVVAALPGMLRHWSVGEAGPDLVPVLTRHGPHAAEDLWYDTATLDSGSLWAVLPDVGRFFIDNPDRAKRFAAAIQQKDDVRVIIPTGVSDDPVAAPSMQRYGGAGVEYRMVDVPPSWFWVDGDQLAVPFEWGEGRPTSVLCVRNPALAGLARAYFEKLWQRADPVQPPEHVWTPLLRMMRKGVTLETASRMLGINPRTGRRRVSAAMEHYGVSTLFALGVAWSAEDERAR